MPPDVREWLPPGHPALFVAELVGELDMSAFVQGYRSTPDRGRPAYHPEVMVGIVLYASMTAVMSSRRIERLLATDVGFRVVAANERPDHGTICRFLVRHKAALEGLFAQVVGLAAEAGLIDPTLVALDGTKLPGDASPQRNVKLGDLRRRFAAWADTVGANDAADDEAEAERGGRDGPVDAMFERDSMREWIRARLDEREGDEDDRQMNTTDPDSGLLKRSGGGWVQGYNAQAAAVAGGIVVAADVTASTNDSEVLEPMTRKIGAAVAAATGESAGVIVADAGYWNAATIEAIDADDEAPDVLVAPGQKLPDQAPEPLPGADPDHEAAVTAYEQRLRDEHARRVRVIAKVIKGELLLREAGEELGLSTERVFQLKKAWVADSDPDAVRPRKLPGRPKRPPGPSRAARTRHAVEHRLARPAGRSLYRQRKTIIEPVFGDIKTNRRITRFLRRGLDNVRTEWNWILTGHNLTIIHRQTG
jgi:transposase